MSKYDSNSCGIISGKLGLEKYLSMNVAPGEGLLENLWVEERLCMTADIGETNLEEETLTILA